MAIQHVSVSTFHKALCINELTFLGETVKSVHPRESTIAEASPPKSNILTHELSRHQYWKGATDRDVDVSKTSVSPKSPMPSWMMASSKVNHRVLFSVNILLQIPQGQLLLKNGTRVGTVQDPRKGACDPPMSNQGISIAPLIVHSHRCIDLFLFHGCGYLTNDISTPRLHHSDHIIIEKNPNYKHHLLFFS